LIALLITRTVARKFSIGGLCSSAGGLDITKLTKTPLIYSVSRFNLGGLGAAKPTKDPRGNGTGYNRLRLNVRTQKSFWRNVTVICFKSWNCKNSNKS